MGNTLPKNAADFIIKLAGADAAEINGYVSGFRLDRRLQDGIAEKKAAFGKSGRGSWGYGIGGTAGLVLYILCRRCKPDVVVETGVASGVSSTHILGALERNKRGRLYSIDQPGWMGDLSGWLIPDYLGSRWHLIAGRSSEKLVPLLKKVAPIDVFLHDSDHSYPNMFREFETAWKSLKAGGLLLAHNIDSNDAFSDFCRDKGVRGYLLDNLGGMLKP